MGLLGLGLGLTGAMAGAQQGAYNEMNKKKAAQYKAFPQVDVQPALSLMAGAIKSMNDYSNMGLGAYQSAFNEAKSTVKKASEMVASQIRPISQAGMKSYNEYLKLTGQDPIQGTAGYADRVETVGFSGDVSGIKNLMNLAENEQDATKRAAYKTQIIDQLKSAQLTNNVDREIAALGAVPSPVGIISYPKAYKLGPDGNFMEYNDKDTYYAMQKAMAVEYDARKQNYDLQVQAIKNKWGDTAVEQAQARNELINDFTNNYKDNYEKAYTQEQVNKKITETQGYNLALTQGSQAIARQAAATGMLGSGNTGAALMKYGQDLATNTYQNYLSNIMGEAQVGLAAGEQLNQLTSNTASILSQLDQNYGAQVYNTLQGMGQNAGQGLMQMADNYLKTATQNVNNLIQYKMEREKNETSKAVGAMGSASQLGSSMINNQGAAQRLGMQLSSVAALGNGMAAGYGGGGGSSLFGGSFNSYSGFRFGGGYY